MFKFIFKIFIIILAFTTVWYGTSRLGSNGKAVTSYTLRSVNNESKPGKRDFLHIATFNIAHGRGPDLNASNWQGRSIAGDKKHLDEIATSLKDLDLDIVVLNEVDFSAAWSNQINQAKHIAEKAGFSHVVEQRNIDIGIPFFNFKFGNAILSKHPIVETHYLEFEPYSTLENIFAGNHNGACAIIDSPQGKIGVFAIHLDSRSAAHRLNAAKDMRRFSEKLGHATVAMGDFNSAPKDHINATSNEAGDNAISYLLDDSIFEGDRRVKDHQRYYTFPAEEPDRVIDWILVNKDYDITNIKTDNTGLSDHLLISAKLRN